MVTYIDGCIVNDGFSRPRTEINDPTTFQGLTGKQWNVIHSIGFAAGSTWIYDTLSNDPTLTERMKWYLSSAAGIVGMSVAAGFTILLPKNLKILGAAVPLAITGASVYSSYRRIKNRRKNDF